MIDSDQDCSSSGCLPWCYLTGDRAMAMKLLLEAAILMSLGGCVSQIFLDGEPPGDVTRIAAGGISKRVHVVSSTACESGASAALYEIRENKGRQWIPRCASIQGFDYRPGNDYILQITEYAPTSVSSVRLVLDKVIEERPHDQE
jgi:hypothetical protein